MPIQRRDPPARPLSRRDLRAMQRELAIIIRTVETGDARSILDPDPGVWCTGCDAMHPRWRPKPLLDVLHPVEREDDSGGVVFILPSPEVL